jgi:hypothetical protein
MRPAPLLLAVGLVLAGAAACSDDGGGEADAPPVTGTDATFCEQLRTAITDDTTIFDPLQPTTPEATSEATDALADAAPEAVAAPMRLLATTFADVAAVLEQYDPADPEAAQAIEDLHIDQAALADAQQRVSDYATETCGIDIEAINAASVTTTTAAVTLPPTTVAPTTVPVTTAPPTTG